MKREMRCVRFLFSVTCLVILSFFMSTANAQQLYSRTRTLSLPEATDIDQVSRKKSPAHVVPTYASSDIFHIMSPIEEPASSPVALIAPAPLMTAFGVAGDTGSYRYGYAYSNYNSEWTGRSFGNSNAFGGTNLFGWSNYPFSSSNLLGWPGYSFGGNYNLFNGNFLANWFNSQLSGGHDTVGHDTVPPVDGGKPGDPIGQPNPAAIYCTENGGDYQITTSADGSQDGICVFSDGSECDGWAYYRGECQPSGNQQGVIGMDVVYCTENGGAIAIRRNEEGNRYKACVFDDGSECDAWAYYRGECQPSGNQSGHDIMPPLDGGNQEAPIGIANPAWVYCKQNGGESKIRTSEDGSQYVACVLSDGSECDEWAFFKGECRTSDRPQIIPPHDDGKPGAPIGMANPASVYCTENGGESEIRTDENGGQYGVCVFSDKSECDEWAYFRGECRTSDRPQIAPSLDGGELVKPIGMANPASVYCTENGGESKIRTSEDGSQYGVCVFSDGSECDEWAYFRGECQPSDAPGTMYPLMMPPRMMPPLYDGNLMGNPSILPLGDTSVLGMANPAAVYCEENGGTYEIRTDEDGSQSGVCVYSDGKECPDYAFFKDGPQR